MRLSSIRTAVPCLLILLAGTAKSQAAFPTLALKPVCLKQIHSPTTITYAPDGSGRVFICDEPGKIYIFQNGMLLPTPFLNIASASNAPPNNGPGPVIAEGLGYSERGLLGLAFHPGYANPASPGYRKFYLNYDRAYVTGVDAPPLGPLTGTNPGTLTGNAVSVIAEYQVSPTDPNVALLASERRLLVYTQPQNNHNGGQVEFGPEVGPNGERYLYIGVGDGGSQQDNDLGHNGGNNTNPRPTSNLGNGQDKTRLFGKILRIDPLGTNGPGGQYGIPVDNPFVGVGGGVREEIFSYGMRNPWRFSFDKRPGGTNRLFCGDVGGDRIEEVDIIESGGNYGWRYLEGTEFPTFSSGSPTSPMTIPQADIDALVDPIAVYAHSNLPANDPTPLPKLGLSVTGGFVYRGVAIPALQGKYIFGDYGATSGTWDGRIMGLEEDAPLSYNFSLTQAIPFINSSNPVVGQRILTFGEDESGEIYIGMKSKSGVLALDPDGTPSGGIYKIVPLEPTVVSVPASQDNTIFSEDTTPTQVTSYWPFTSDGQGYLFVGRTGTNYGPYLRRALVAFDLAGQVPAGAVIQSAQLQLWNVLRTGQSANAAGKTISLKRLTETWGEGSSMNDFDGAGYGGPAATGDATWTRRFYNTSSWTTPGGTFAGTASATSVVPVTNGTVMLTWGPTAQLAADVQGWVNTPSSNAGWILIGDETVSPANTASASRFSSVQQGGLPPTLVITYGSAPSATHFETWLATYFPTNAIGQFVDPNGDNDGDGIANQVEYAFGFSPVAKNNMSDGLNATSAPDGSGGTNFTITFRRDPLATDLTYRLQTSGDLVTWTTIAQCVGGATPTGNVVSDNDVVPAAPPYRLVTVLEHLAQPSNQRRYTRLQIVRATP